MRTLPARAVAVAVVWLRLVWTVCRWTFDDSLNGFTITTMRAIDRGEQVYDSYGRKCNRYGTTRNQLRPACTD